jgi:hypothetical protein
MIELNGKNAYAVAYELAEKEGYNILVEQYHNNAAQHDALKKGIKKSLQAEWELEPNQLDSYHVYLGEEFLVIRFNTGAAIEELIFSPTTYESQGAAFAQAKKFAINLGYKYIVTTSSKGDKVSAYFHETYIRGKKITDTIYQRLSKPIKFQIGTIFKDDYVGFLYTDDNNIFNEDRVHYFLFAKKET